MDVSSVKLVTIQRSPGDGAGNRIPPLYIAVKTKEGMVLLVGFASLPDVTLSAMAAGALTPLKIATRPGSPSAERTPCVCLATTSDVRLTPSPLTVLQRCRRGLNPPELGAGYPLGGEVSLTKRLWSRLAGRTSGPYGETSRTARPEAAPPKAFANSTGVLLSPSLPS